jgi:2-polyprenyl-3-methyl-5-hydroxy-6-metoxy-1,4-benzoquinol methylase
VDRLPVGNELIDGPLDDREALEANLRDLRRLNRLTGGAGLSVRAIRELLPAGGTILDVGTGGADIPVRLLADARQRGTPLEVTATDSRREVLDAALAVLPGLADLPGLRLELGDGLDLAYGDGSFDVAHASLVLHHLDGPDAVSFLRELRRVSRRGIVVNDLGRSWWFWLGAWLVTRSARASHFTRHDGPLSVRTAWTVDEMEILLRKAGLEPVRRLTGFAGHRYAIVAR